MKKTLLTLSLLMAMASGNAQNLYKEDFNFGGASPFSPPVGWTFLNNSTSEGTKSWNIGNPNYFYAQAGAQPMFYMADSFKASANSGASDVISDWAITPVVALQNGDVISFYSRIIESPALFPDRLEMRIGVGDNPEEPVGTDGVGGYTIEAVTINSGLVSDGYPATWTKYTYTVTGMPTPTNCKVAFRYYVTGLDKNGEYLGLDTFSVDRPAAGTQEFFASNFSLQPNPVNDIFNLTSKNGAAIENVKVIDMNGRVVNETNPSNTDVRVDISNLNAGVYFVKAQSELGIGTYKIVKR